MNTPLETIRKENSMPAPLISVVIPTCHRNDLLAKCLDRLAPGVQTLPPQQYEVIVTDDGSRSTAQQMVKESYPWAQWTEGPRRGPAANRNHGATLAKGEWLAFTDDDCLPTSGWLEAFAQATKLDKEGALIYEGRTTCEAGISSPLYEAPINLEGGLLWSCNFMIIKPVFDRLNGFDENFAMPSMEDTDFRERLQAGNLPLNFVAMATVDHPPRRKPSGKHLGKKYEANVQYWYKTGHSSSFFMSFLKHIKHRLYFTNQFVSHKEYLPALCDLLVETVYVLTHLLFWERKMKMRYCDSRKYSKVDTVKQL